jgi:RimJ/RimL family protein N-acetyltransferase
MWRRSRRRFKRGRPSAGDAQVRPGGRTAARWPTALRPWRDSDIPALVDACRDPEIPRWTRVPSPYGHADARLYLQQRFDALHAAATAPYAVVDRARDSLPGSISLIRFAWEHGRAEVGYWLAREARGTGHAVRALRLICRWGFDKPGLERIELLAATGNVPSRRVAERGGFRREALLRPYFPHDEERHEMIAYGLLADQI